MNKKLIIPAGFGVIVIIVLIFWLDYQEKQHKQLITEKDDRIIDLEINNLTLMIELINAPIGLPASVKKQLLDLIENYELKDTQIASELKSVVNLIEIGEFEKAVFSIAKIIENILKLKFHKNSDFEKYIISLYGKKKRPTFKDYIDYVYENGVIDKGEHLLALALKERRNEEAHEIAVKREENYNIGSILTGIVLIIKCKNLEAKAETILVSS